MDNKPEQEHLIGYDEYDQTGSEQIKTRKRKQRIGMVILIFIVIAIVSGSLIFYFVSRKKNSTSENQDGRDFTRGHEQQSVISATGTTAIGRDEVNFDIDFLEDTDLYIEEVYVSSGDEVEAGTKYIKFTDDSIVDARNELEETLETAKLSYQSSVITTKQSQIELKYTYDKAMLDAQQAQGEYDDELASLQSDFDDAKSAYDDAKEAYDELNNQITNNTFYADYEVAEKKQAYTEAQEVYDDRVVYWEITDDELKSATSTSSSGSSSTSTSNASVTTTATSAAPGAGGKVNEEEKKAQQERSWIVKTIGLLAQEVENTEAEYETAQADYEYAVSHAELNLKLLASELEKAKNTYEETNLKYQKDILTAKTTYETAMAKSKTAKSEYEVQLESLSEALDKLKDVMTEAQDNLTLFETEIGDGYLYTEEAGTILMIRAKAGDILSGNDLVMAYSKPNEITVSVAVAQDSIAELTVGDEANIIIDGYETYTGKITMINPISSSDSKTSVTYTVTIAVDGDVSALSENLTATVVFGEIPNESQTIKNGEKPSRAQKSENGEMPEAIAMPNGENIPNEASRQQKNSEGETSHE